MRMIERRQLADAHEFARADLDDRNARRIVEMRNDGSAMCLSGIHPRR